MRVGFVQYRDRLGFLGVVRLGSTTDAGNIPALSMDGLIDAPAGYVTRCCPGWFVTSCPRY